VPYESFPTADGDILLGGGNDRLYAILCERLHHPEWITDHRFVTNSQRVKFRDILVLLISAETRKHTTQHWLKVFERSGMPYAPINDVKTTLEHRHTLARGMVQTVTHKTAGEVKVVGVPVKYSESTPGVRLAPPMLGEHTDEVLGGLGLDGEAIAELREAGVVG
jgi:succinate--hydroxymethylglutarate CoA-transferase